MNKIAKGLMFLSLGTFLFSQNILTNPSFEDSLTGWNIYPSTLTNRSIESTGNKVYGSERTVTARSGAKMLKTWGQYNGGANETPSYYEGDTEAGKVYNFSAYGMTHADDKLRGNAKAWIQIKFFNTAWEELPGDKSAVMSAASDTNAWHYLYTNATAPANAVKVQAVIVHSQDGGDDHGAVYWDDAYFTMNHFTQIGLVTSKTLWAGSGGDVRGMAAGSDLDGDGKKEVWATHYNVPGYKGGLGGDGVYGFEYLGTDTLVQIFDETAPFTPQNLLPNPGFEDATDSLKGWNVYPSDKSTYASVVYNVGTDTARTGTGMLKMTGVQDANDVTAEHPRYYEDQEAVPGDYYIFEGYAYTPVTDSLVGSSIAFLWLKYFDANWGMIGSDSSKWMESTTEPGKWTHLSVAGTVPAGTKTVQAVINYTTFGSASAWGGVAYFDDMGLWKAVGPKSTYETGTRNVATGDLDGDGKGEVIFVKGRYTDDPQSGVWVYEADGTDNGFSAPWHVNINAFASDSVKWGTTEEVVVDDVDGDGRDELLFSFNGGSNPNAGYSTYSEDRFFVMGVEGDIGVLPKAVEEFVIAPRDRNKDGVRGNDHGGGSAVSMVVADSDGDGKKEIAFFSWNSGNMFVAEATGANTYAAPDSGEYVRFGSSSFPGNTAGKDDFSFNPTAIDMDGDGKDEIYATGYYTQNLYVYADKDGDAMKIGADEVSLVARGHRFGLTAVNSVKDHGAGYFNMSPYGVPTLFAGGNAGSELAKITLRADSSVLGGVSSWDVVKYDTKAGGGFNNKPVAGVDFNRNGKGEVVLAYQGTDDGGTYIQIMEYSESSTKLSVERELTIITPEDYKLSQNYPNPFNPTTTIQYTLPMRDKITVTVYNMLGQEIVRLMNNEEKPAGTYQLSWNGLDKNGVQVSSGMYIYSMSSPHMRKTMRMTFLK